MRICVSGEDIVGICCGVVWPVSTVSFVFHEVNELDVVRECIEPDGGLDDACTYTDGVAGACTGLIGSFQ